MRRILTALTLLAACGPRPGARADVFQFDTRSTADLTIVSPLLGGGVTLHAAGTQHFTIDTTNGTASVASPFQGSDFPDPVNIGHFDTYDAYNTATTGTLTLTPAGYDLRYELLFELKLTSGPLAGLTFETKQDATFEASGLPTIPFPFPTAFSDPSGNDAVNLYVKFDPTGTFASGTQVGVSEDRVVTALAAVPEPSTWALSALAFGALAVARRRTAAARRGS